MFVRVYVLACEYICACVCDLCFPRIESGNHVKLLLNAPPPAAFTRRKRRRGIREESHCDPPSPWRAWVCPADGLPGPVPGGGGGGGGGDEGEVRVEGGGGRA